MNLKEVLEPIDLPAFTECSGVIDGWHITITKTSQEPASPAWVMPHAPDPVTGEMRPWCWRTHVDAGVKRLQEIVRGMPETECDFNVSFPLDGMAYLLTVKLHQVKEGSSDDQSKERSLRRLQKRASGGQ